MTCCFQCVLLPGLILKARGGEEREREGGGKFILGLASVCVFVRHFASQGVIATLLLIQSLIRFSGPPLMNED